VLESSYGDAFENEYSSSTYRPAKADGRDAKMDAMANIAARRESLTEQLRRQWTFAEVEEHIAKAGEILISFLDDDGIISTDLETVLEQSRNVPDVELSLELLNETIDELQKWLEPPGVAARSRRECFLLQIDALEAMDEHADHNWDDVRTLLGEHYEDLLQNRLPKIAQESEMTLEAIQAALERRLYQGFHFYYLPWLARIVRWSRFTRRADEAGSRTMLRQGQRSRPMVSPLSNIGPVDLLRDHGAFSLQGLEFVMALASSGLFGSSVCTFRGALRWNFSYAAPAVSRERAERVAACAVDSLVRGL